MDESDVISCVRLYLGQDKNTVCVIVEGPDDEALFNSKFSENVVVLQSQNGKKGVDNIVSGNFSQNVRVIGICDKDYSNVPPSKHCFFCDYCCAEMMIAAIDECFIRICNEFNKAKNVPNQDLRLYCLKHLEALSRYRELNEKNSWNIRFDGIKPSKCFCHDVKTMNDNIEQEINNQNPYNGIGKERRELFNLMPDCVSEEEYLNITNGHDFVNLFYKICTGKYGRQGVEAVAIALRASFGQSEFKNTLLFSQLLKYQNKHNIRLLAQT